MKQKTMYHSIGRLLAALLILLTSQALSAQAEAEADQPGWLKRFTAIFEKAPQEEPTVDSLTAAETSFPGLTERYSTIYNLIHREQLSYYKRLADSSHTRYEELTDLPEADYISPDGDTVVLATNVKVFGWHPHWMGGAYKSYPFDLLSHIALFSYNVNAGDGEPFDNPEAIDYWETEGPEIVKMAHETKCKVMLTITSFGRTRNRDFLSNPERQQRLIDDIVDRLVRMGADGIDVDFELIPPNFEQRFSAFILRLKERLDLGDKRYQLSVVLPKVNGTVRGPKIYDMKYLQQHVDFFTLTAYDFRTGDNDPGPISPLYNADRKRRAFSSIEDVIYNYLEDSLDRKKLLLALPYYGGRWSNYWRTDEDSIRRANTPPDTTTFKHVTYSAIRKANRGNGPPEYNRDAWSAVYRETTESDLFGFDQREDITWFDDSLTLNRKYDWVLEQGLGGIGIWALGYDLPHTELWGLVDEKFAPVNDTLVHFSPAQSAWDIPRTLMRYSDVFGISGLFVFGFLAMGFLIALFDWRVRDVFFKHRTLRLFYIVASFALVTATLAVVLFLREDLLGYLQTGWTSLIVLVLGMVSGIFLVRIISRWFTSRREATP